MMYGNNDPNTDCNIEYLYKMRIYDSVKAAKFGHFLASRMLVKRRSIDLEQLPCHTRWCLQDHVASIPHLYFQKTSLSKVCACHPSPPGIRHGHPTTTELIQFQQKHRLETLLLEQKLVSMQGVYCDGLNPFRSNLQQIWAEFMRREEQCQMSEST